MAQDATPVSLYQEEKRQANANTVTIMGAGITGTYMPMAQDLQSVLDDHGPNGLRVLPIMGLGGGQNVLDMLFLKGVDMGITQQEHLQYFKKQNPTLHTNIYDRIHYITKLYNSEYHLVAKKNITSFHDLRGKKVHFYKQNSATDIGGQTIFDILGIDVEVIHGDLESGIHRVKTGEVAAATLLAGAPISGFVNRVAREDGLHFVPLSAETLEPGQFQALMGVFLPASLKHETYPNLILEGEQVSTVASGAVLGVYAWPEDTDRYRRVAEFVNRFFDNFDKFRREPRHPKWQEVNLATELPGWTRFKAAQEWLDANRSATIEDSEMRAAFEKFVNDYAQASGVAHLTAAQQKAIYTQFVDWWNQRRR